MVRRRGPSLILEKVLGGVRAVAERASSRRYGIEPIWGEVSAELATDMTGGHLDPARHVRIPRGWRSTLPGCVGRHLSERFA